MLGLNNKGMSIIEIVLTFALVMFISIGMLAIVMNYRTKAQISIEKMDLLTYKNTLTKDIQDDLLKRGVKEINVEGECRTISGLKQCINIVFKDDSQKILGIGSLDVTKKETIENKYIYYDGIKYKISDTLPDKLPNGRTWLDFQNITVEGNLVTDNSIVSSDTITLEDGTVVVIYSIDIYITHIDFSEDFGIHIVATTEDISL